MTKQWDAKDKTFIITGGASGLGAEYVKAFLGLGAKNVAILDIAEELGKAAAERLNKQYNDKVVFIKCDMSKEEDISNAFDTVLQKFKKIDVIINNAGIMSDAPNLWRTACEVNWQGLISLTLKGIKYMRKDEGGAGGTIINISSTAALTQFPFLPVYNGSKMAVLHFSQCIAMDPFYERTNVRVLTMCPGATDTPLLHNLEARAYQPNLGQEFVDMVKDMSLVYQSVEAATAALVHMAEYGAPGTVWLTIDNKPAKDITPVISRVFKDLENAIME
ncbi:15-hydroxyprostaglandin dehydrogenase [NAD(+)]-like [Anticarsia gemmatalis]|uniref:15-hydroxyprostaglandin dehydrogenase [NAD(+)]-like n=1 Tax=Anticarsia gemmatalis TaxID=129554 RepID=UPI003F7758E5